MSFILASNWKMHKTPQEAQDFFSALKQAQVPVGQKLLFFVPSLLSYVAQAELSGTSHQWGAQNIYPEKQGAFTGETSPYVIAAMGGEWTLVGHSERRQLFAETNSIVNKKVKVSLEMGLKVCLCVGENREQRQQGQTLEVIQEQLQSALADVSDDALFVIAYEPVWAIGTGDVAGVEQISEVHGFIKSWLKQNFPKNTGDVLYGGSVKPDNAAEISSLKEVDGFLIGGASLQVESLLAIANTVQK